MAISKETAKKYGTCTVIAAWLAVFCLFGYRSSFSIMQTSLVDGMGLARLLLHDDVLRHHGILQRLADR